MSNFVGFLVLMPVMGEGEILSGRGGLVPISLAAMWVWAMYLVRHRQDIYEEIRYRRSDEARVRAPWFARKWHFLHDIPAACW